jgi:hypothetical protein
MFLRRIAKKERLYQKNQEKNLSAEEYIPNEEVNLCTMSTAADYFDFSFV